ASSIWRNRGKSSSRWTDGKNWLAVEPLTLGFIHHQTEVVVVDDIRRIRRLGMPELSGHVTQRNIVFLRAHIDPRRSAQQKHCERDERKSGHHKTTRSDGDMRWPKFYGECLLQF